MCNRRGLINIFFSAARNYFHASNKEEKNPPEKKNAQRFIKNFVSLLVKNLAEESDCRTDYIRSLLFISPISCVIWCLSCLRSRLTCTRLVFRTSARRLLTASPKPQCSSAPHRLIKQVCLLHMLHLIPRLWQIIVAALSCLITLPGLFFRRFCLIVYLPNLFATCFR